MMNHSQDIHMALLSSYLIWYIDRRTHLALAVDLPENLRKLLGVRHIGWHASAALYAHPEQLQRLDDKCCCCARHCPG